MIKLRKMGNPMVCFLISLASLMAALVMPYCEGRSNSVWVIPPLLPAELLPFVLLFASCGALGFYWVRSLVARRHAFAVGLVFLASLLFFGVWFGIDRANLYQLGFRDYAKNALTPDEWRNISRYAQKNMVVGVPFSETSKYLWDQKSYDQFWSGLTNATPIRKLAPSFAIIVRPESTEIVWGGALTGHRGVTITANGNDGFKTRKPPRAMFIAPDIAVGLDSD
jgi:hypothetical protein